MAIAEHAAPLAAARTVFEDPAAPTRLALWKLPYLLTELATIAVVAASLPRRAAA